MSSKFRDLWVRWKTLKLPWRQKWVVGMHHLRRTLQPPRSPQAPSQYLSHGCRARHHIGTVQVSPVLYANPCYPLQDKTSPAPSSTNTARTLSPPPYPAAQPHTLTTSTPAMYSSHPPGCNGYEIRARTHPQYKNNSKKCSARATSKC